VDQLDSVTDHGDENLPDDDNYNIMTPEASVNFMLRLKTLRNTPFVLPKTVSVIECVNGTKVYIVGTAHFSKESIEDVILVMEHTLPDIVLVELCPNRSHSMLLSEEDLKRQISENSITSMIKDLGVSNGLLQYLLLRFTNYIMKQIGMAPGGEFRAAFQQASKQPHCHVVLGDRPIAVTMARTLSALGVWQKTKILFSLLFGLEPITPEDVESMKNEDLLEKLMKNLAGDYPELSRTILNERDIFLTKSIWDCCGFRASQSTVNAEQKEAEQEENEVRQRSTETAASALAMESTERDSEASLSDSFDAIDSDALQNDQDVRCCSEWLNQSELPRVVVAVVGLGHVAGIKSHWDTAASIDKKSLMFVEPPTKRWLAFKWTSKIVFLSSLAYGIYWLSYGIYRTTYFCFEQASYHYFRFFNV